MDVLLEVLIKCLDQPDRKLGDVIVWSSPVPVFGDLATSLVASLGLNPSNREFVDKAGEELVGERRRFHTLRSLGINRWSEAGPKELMLVAESCRNYFKGNPYDGWFRRLDVVICGTGASYYGGPITACHLDLFPFATETKWGQLASNTRKTLLRESGEVIGPLLRDSKVKVLILNGSSVVQSFEEAARVTLKRTSVPEWDLGREGGVRVAGVAFEGRISRLANMELEREILVLGFNHNIQSSFGVRTEVIGAIQKWVGEKSKGAI